MPDTDLDTSKGPDPRMSSVHRWRPAFQADFAARLDWCVRPFTEANHPPVVRIAGDREWTIKASDVVSLDAAGTTDPDGEGLDFAWGIHPVDPDLTGKVGIEGKTSPQARVVVPPGMAGEAIPILLTVTDRGEPKLTRHGRALIRVGAAESHSTCLVPLRTTTRRIALRRPLVV